MKACFPGSFDPVSLGHLDIINRAAKLYDTLYIVVSNNVKKNYLFTALERKEMIEAVCGHLNNIIVVIEDDLITRFCEKMQINVIIRGLRNINDYQNEFTLAKFNKDLAPEIETVLLFTDNDKEMISSSAIKELIYYNAKIDKYVPKILIDKITNKLKRN